MLIGLWGVVAMLMGCYIGWCWRAEHDDTEYPTHIEERWLELQRVTKDEWCHFMRDTSHRKDWQRWFTNMKERRKNDEED